MHLTHPWHISIVGKVSPTHLVLTLVLSNHECTTFKNFHITPNINAMNQDHGLFLEIIPNYLYSISEALAIQTVITRVSLQSNNN